MVKVGVSAADLWGAYIPGMPAGSGGLKKPPPAPAPPPPPPPSKPPRPFNPGVSADDLKGAYIPGAEGGLNPTPSYTPPPQATPAPSPAPTEPQKDPNDVYGQRGGWKGDKWASGTGGYPVPNPALEMPPGEARNRAENKWKGERNAWIGQNYGDEVLSEFQRTEHQVWNQGKTEGETAAAEAQELEDLGPEYDIEAPQWSINPYGEAEQYDVPDRYGIAAFDEQTMRDPRSMNALNFNPYRRAALEDVSRTSNRNLATAEEQLARTGGLSTADRMALASQANRAKIEGRQGALNQLAGMEAQNLYSTQAANVGAMNLAQGQNAAESNRRAGVLQGQESQANKDFWAATTKQRENLADEKNRRSAGNTEMANQYSKEMATAQYKNDLTKYGAEAARHNLGKRLEYAREAAKHGNGGVNFIDGSDSWPDIVKNLWGKN